MQNYFKIILAAYDDCTGAADLLQCIQDILAATGTAIRYRKNRWSIPNISLDLLFLGVLYNTYIIRTKIRNQLLEYYIFT